MEKKQTVTEQTCKQCGNTWLPRIQKPKMCPYCKNRHWQETRKIRYQKTEK